jgi:hypothetical protein
MLRQLPPWLVLQVQKPAMPHARFLHELSKKWRRDIKLNNICNAMQPNVNAQKKCVEQQHRNVTLCNHPQPRTIANTTINTTDINNNFFTSLGKPHCPKRPQK